MPQRIFSFSGLGLGGGSLWLAQVICQTRALVYDTALKGSWDLVMGVISSETTVIVMYNPNIKALITLLSPMILQVGISRLRGVVYSYFECYLKGQGT